MKTLLALLLIIPSLSWGYKGFLDADCKRLEMNISILGGIYKGIIEKQKADDFEKNQKHNESLRKTSSNLADLITIYNYYCKEE